MPSIPPLSAEENQRRVDALREHGSVSAAASALDMSESTLRKWATRAAKRGELGYKPTLPGFEITRTTTVYDKDGDVAREFVTQGPERSEVFEMPEGQRLKRVSANIDSEGRINNQWVITEPDKIDPIEVAEKIASIFDQMKFEVPVIAPPEDVLQDCMSFFPAGDLHMGLYGWGKEVGENWHLKKADRVYRQRFSELVSMTPHNDTAVLLLGGDQMHSDNSTNRTLRSGHALDVDGRYEEVLFVTCEMIVYFITLLLQTHRHVVVRVLKGNHDEHSSAALAYFLLATFRNDPRVTIDVSPSLYWVFQFGKVMLMATHGHTVKAQKMSGIMAARWPEMWGTSLFRYGHSFHIHHIEKFKDENGGAIIETHHSPAPQDNFNYGGGYCSGRTFKSIVYHKEFGEWGGSVRPVMWEAD